MNDWQVNQTERDGARLYTLRVDGARASYREVVDHWRTDGEFRRFFADILRAVPFDAYFWETPPVTAATLDRDFEFVAIDAPILTDVTANARPFAEHFGGSEPITEFHNLGRDALLVVPEPGLDADYAHLGAFLRSARSEVCDELWRRVGEAVAARLSDEPVWVSTSGAGVYWLHVRLDSRPKYYQWAPYRSRR